MKSHLLLFGVLSTIALACESRETLTASIESSPRVPQVAAAQSNKTAPSKQVAPTTPSTPAPKPAEKGRGRPPRPEFLFL